MKENKIETISPENPVIQGATKETPEEFEKRMNKEGIYKNAFGSWSIPGWWGIPWSSPFRSNAE